ncbi:hypothetical protein [uncultured Aquimarina sp.]|uniref:hypothetical protein n=1 Tax=uncultured Aquimarina sp. TaxID=575652 RepID=UPI002619F100|nr:hypothetical protein [uncultured Aquimarina sp.]
MKIDKEREELQREFETAQQWLNENGKLSCETISINEKNYTKATYTCDEFVDEVNHEDSIMAVINLYIKVQ